ncbi:LPS biosynthesi protein [Halorhabdus tiamatea SARL4B]|nr:LPS biosynthesi protein [Halorhabdus tiamatea SARL4B]
MSFDGDGTETRDGITIQRLGSISNVLTEWQNLRAYPKLRNRVDEFDLIHAYNMELHPIVGALSGRTKPATVGTLNSYHFFPRSVTMDSPGPLEWLYEMIGHPTTGRLLEYFVRQMDAHIAISEAVRDLYVEFGYSSEKIKVVPNMIDPAFEVRRDIGTDDKDGTTEVLYVGELSVQKGVRFLIDAIAALPSAYRATIVGDGDQRTTLEQQVRALGVENRVTFQGQVPYEEVSSKYGLADVFVHPGIWPEPFGRTILEAMQAGLPVVCTDIGGPADIVRNPELRCEPGDHEALAASIRYASENGATIGERNQRYVENEYSPATVVSEIIDLYERLLDGERV